MMFCLKGHHQLKVLVPAVWWLHFLFFIPFVLAPTSSMKSLNAVNDTFPLHGAHSPAKLSSVFDTEEDKYEPNSGNTVGSLMSWDPEGAMKSAANEEDGREERIPNDTTKTIAAGASLTEDSGPGVLPITDPIGRQEYDGQIMVHDGDTDDGEGTQDFSNILDKVESSATLGVQETTSVIVTEGLVGQKNPLPKYIVNGTSPERSSDGSADDGKVYRGTEDNVTSTMNMISNDDVTQNPNQSNGKEETGKTEISTTGQTTTLEYNEQYESLPQPTTANQNVGEAENQTNLTDMKSNVDSLSSPHNEKDSMNGDKSNWQKTALIMNDGEYTMFPQTIIEHKANESKRQYCKENKVKLKDILQGRFEFNDRIWAKLAGDFEGFSMYFCALIVAFFLPFYMLCVVCCCCRDVRHRGKLTAIDEDQEVTEATNRRRRHVFAFCSILIALLLIGVSFGLYLNNNSKEGQVVKVKKTMARFSTGFAAFINNTKAVLKFVKNQDFTDLKYWMNEELGDYSDRLVSAINEHIVDYLQEINQSAIEKVETEIMESLESVIVDQAAVERFYAETLSIITQNFGQSADNTRKFMDIYFQWQIPRQKQRYQLRQLATNLRNMFEKMKQGVMETVGINDLLRTFGERFAFNKRPVIKRIHHMYDSVANADEQYAGNLKNFVQYAHRYINLYRPLERFRWYTMVAVSAFLFACGSALMLRAGIRILFGRRQKEQYTTGELVAALLSLGILVLIFILGFLLMLMLTSVLLFTDLTRRLTCRDLEGLRQFGATNVSLAMSPSSPMMKTSPVSSFACNDTDIPTEVCFTKTIKQCSGLAQFGRAFGIPDDVTLPATDTSLLFTSVYDDDFFLDQGQDDQANDSTMWTVPGVLHQFEERFEAFDKIEMYSFNTSTLESLFELYSTILLEIKDWLYQAVFLDPRNAENIRSRIEDLIRSLEGLLNNVTDITESGPKEVKGVATMTWNSIEKDRKILTNRNRLQPVVEWVTWTLQEESAQFTDAYLDNAQNALAQEYGHCTPLFVATVDLLEDILCPPGQNQSHWVWLAVGWILFFLSPAIYLGTALGSFWTELQEYLDLCFNSELADEYEAFIDNSATELVREVREDNTASEEAAHGSTGQTVIEHADKAHETTSTDLTISRDTSKHRSSGEGFLGSEQLQSQPELHEESTSSIDDEKPSLTSVHAFRSSEGELECEIKSSRYLTKESDCRPSVNKPIVSPAIENVTDEEPFQNVTEGGAVQAENCEDDVQYEDSVVILESRRLKTIQGTLKSVGEGSSVETLDYKIEHIQEFVHEISLVSSDEDDLTDGESNHVMSKETGRDGDSTDQGRERATFLTLSNKETVNKKQLKTTERLNETAEVSPDGMDSFRTSQPCSSSQRQAAVSQSPETLYDCLTKGVENKDDPTLKTLISIVTSNDKELTPESKNNKEQAGDKYVYVQATTETHAKSKRRHQGINAKNEVTTEENRDPQVSPREKKTVSQSADKENAKVKTVLRYKENTQAETNLQRMEPNSNNNIRQTQGKGNTKPGPDKTEDRAGSQLTLSPPDPNSNWPKPNSKQTSSKPNVKQRLNAPDIKQTPRAPTARENSPVPNTQQIPPSSNEKRASPRPELEQACPTPDEKESGLVPGTNENSTGLNTEQTSPIVEQVGSLAKQVSPKPNKEPTTAYPVLTQDPPDTMFAEGRDDRYQPQASDSMKLDDTDASKKATGGDSSDVNELDVLLGLNKRFLGWKKRGLTKQQGTVELSASDAPMRGPYRRRKSLGRSVHTGKVGASQHGNIERPAKAEDTETTKAGSSQEKKMLEPAKTAGAEIKPGSSQGKEAME